MTGIMIELTRTERAARKTDLEAALTNLKGVIAVSESRGGDDLLVFPETRDAKGNLNPLYDISGDASVSDISALIKCNGWDVLRALPYR